MKSNHSPRQIFLIHCQKWTLLYIPIALRGHKLYPTANLWMKSITELHQRGDVQFETADDLSNIGLKL